jgi:hypothetical protein
VYIRVGPHFQPSLNLGLFLCFYLVQTLSETLTYPHSHLTLLEFIAPVSALLIQICIQPFNRLEVEKKRGGETPWRLLARRSPRRSSILRRQQRRESIEERIRRTCPRRRRLGRREYVRPKSASVGCHLASLESAARSIEALLGRYSLSLYGIRIREKGCLFLSEIYWR